ncbi:GTP-binding protein TypA [[Clostridium] methylpentosum DSM 5476]|uniref:Large ribosomal subunit assembly factor BipA n=1 Tax=[Clostridium] methylpentosum DSM 5476 TaxID=537013 RepID=C0E990_9FIRM|nr:GTP-binding protein TypA [[Clostridium] methylpentosum DSM 5476]MEE1491900.1 translational GTPase TypA [Massilioclostridium sp.]
MIRNDLRNIAIVAHVDHGKTTLVDEMLKQGGAYRENQVIEERVMDSNDLERERGITILAKNTAVTYKDTKINLIDTPGHADFGGEVERVLKMVDGVILLVDAAEGPMPQTRFVTQKALELGLKIIVVVNKIDRPDARLDEIPDEVLELLLDLDASEEQLECPMLFCSGRSGTASFSQYEAGTDLQPLFETIMEYIDPPSGDEEGPTQMLVSSIDYNEYVGRIAIGKVERGVIKQGETVTICDFHGNHEPYQGKIVNLYQIDSFGRSPIEQATVGDIVCISGIDKLTIGDTICANGVPEPIAFSKISEPTVEMTFAVNDSPFAGREGKFVTSRQIRDRLMKELLKDVSLRVEDADSSEKFNVSGRGEMHLSILIETMRREGFEFSVSTPRVLFKEIDGVKCEPMEELVIDVPEESLGSVMEKMGSRKAEMTHMEPVGSRMRVKFLIPSRGLFGYRSEFLTDTKGEGILNTIFAGYQPYKGEIPTRANGSLISFETGEAVTYGLYNAQERGTLFISPGTPVYEGMVVGCSPKAEDLVVNVCKKKHVSNMRASGSDEALRLVPPRVMSLEASLEFLAQDELLEVTPQSLRIRKRILSNQLRAKNRAKQ